MRVRRWLSGLAVVVSLGVAMVLAATVATAMPQGPATFSDPAGDSQGAPDVTTVAIDGDATTGTISVAVTALGYLPASPDALERHVTVYMDTDKNRSTGSKSGSEYLLHAYNDSTGKWWSVQRWDGSDWAMAPESATTDFSRSGDVLTWKLNKTDLGGASGFDFYVVAAIRDANGTTNGRDWAPDGDGWWTYDLPAAAPTTPATPPAAKKVALQVFAPETTPRAPVAGKRFTVSFLAAVATSGMTTKIDIATGKITTVPMTTLRFVSGGKMVCDPSVQGKVIAHTESFKSGTARLSFLIPKTAKGKLLKVKVNLTVKDSGSEGSGKTLTASRVATFRIK